VTVGALPSLVLSVCARVYRGSYFCLVHIPFESSIELLEFIVDDGRGEEDDVVDRGSTTVMPMTDAARRYIPLSCAAALEGSHHGRSWPDTRADRYRGGPS
jgi:hypothetical protein